MAVTGTSNSATVPKSFASPAMWCTHLLIPQMADTSPGTSRRRFASSMPLLEQSSRRSQDTGQPLTIYAFPLTAFIWLVSQGIERSRFGIGRPVIKYGQRLHTPIRHNTSCSHQTVRHWPLRVPTTCFGSGDGNLEQSFWKCHSRIGPFANWNSRTMARESWLSSEIVPRSTTPHRPKVMTGVLRPIRA